MAPIKKGIDVKDAHERAVELIPDDFFWDVSDDITPYGNQYGDTALTEFRQWRAKNKRKTVDKFIKIVIDDVGEMDPKDYTVKLLDKANIGNLLTNEEYDSKKLFEGLDMAIIASGFAQLVDEGVVDKDSKRYMRIAIERQIISNQMGLYDEDISREFISYLKILKSVLEKV
jgi:uncharacterized protein YfeS